MGTRRSFLFGTAAVLISAPAVVRAQSLMPLRGIILLTDGHCFGFIERLYVHLHLPKITALQNAGLSAEEIALDLNRCGLDRMTDSAWNAQGVMSVIKRDSLIRRHDLLVRAERLLMA